MLPLTHLSLRSPCPPNRMRANLSTSVPLPFTGGCQVVFRTNVPKPSTCHHRGHSRFQPTARGHWCDNTLALHIGDWASDHTASSSFSNQEPVAFDTTSSEPTRVRRVLIPSGSSMLGGHSDAVPHRHSDAVPHLRFPGMQLDAIQTTPGNNLGSTPRGHRRNTRKETELGPFPHSAEALWTAELKYNGMNGSPLLPAFMLVSVFLLDGTG